ncbi:MAG: hypothetical protein PHV20_02115 [Bacteroidales bacterium]|nr:hypothetical protein [Bacteroidales bacterium]
MKKIILLILIALLGSYMQRASAATITMDGITQTDVKAQVLSAGDGDVIVLTNASGAYTWSSGITTYANSITVKADPSLTTRPTVSCSGLASILFKATPATLKTIIFDGIDFDGAGTATGFISAAAATGGDVEIKINNCVIRNLSASSNFITYTVRTGLTIYSPLTITNSRVIGFGIFTASAAKGSSSSNVTLRNSYFASYAYASNMITNSGGASASMTVDHCTFNNCGTGTKKLFNLSSGMTADIKNNIFVNCAQTAANTFTSVTVTGTGNVVYACGAGMTGFTISSTANPSVPTLPAKNALTTPDVDYIATGSAMGYQNAAVITKSTSTLSGFAYNEGSGPSVAQTFTVSGADLANDLTVTAPTNYEVSLDDATYSSSITLSPTLGVVPTTTVYVRLVTGLAAASYNGVNVTLASLNVTTQNIALTGTVSAGGSAAFTTSTGSLTGFNYIYAQGPSTEQSFTVSGSNLTANVDIAAPTNYEVSLTSGSGFGVSASIPFGSGTLSAVPVYVRLKAGLNSGSYNAENIALTSTGATAQGVSCSGTVTPPTVTITPTSLTSFFALAGSATPSTEKTFTVGGSNLAGDITITPSTNYEISTGTGLSFSATNPITLTPSSGTVSTTTIYVRLKGSLAIASYNENITVATAGTSDATVACTGVVATPIVKVGTTAGTDNKYSCPSVSYVYGAGPSAISATNMYISGDYLQSDVTATAPTGFEVSKDNSTFADFVTYTMSAATVSGNLYIRLKAGLATDIYAGDITLTSTGSVNRLVGITNCPVTGGAVIWGTTANIAITAPAAFSYAGNGPSSSSSNLKITCSGLTSDVTITPSAGFEVSTDNVTFQSTPLAYPNTAGDITAGTIIYTRMAAGLSTGAKTGTITLTATNATTRVVAVSGTVTSSVTKNVATITSNYAGYGPSTTTTLTVTGYNLTGDITVTAPASGNFEMSLTSVGAGFVAASPIVLTRTGNDVAATNIYVRSKANLAAGAYTGEILTIESAGVATQNVTCNATITPSLTSSKSLVNYMNYVPGNGPSIQQSFSVSGLNLTGDVTITPANTDFEISLTSGSGFSNSAIVISPIANDVAATTVYTRLVAGKTAGTYLSTLDITSPSATTVTVNLEGIVDVTVGVDGLVSSANVYTSTNGIVVSGVTAGSAIEVYNGVGQKLNTTVATTGDNRIQLVKGMYIVKVGASVRKVSVR